MDKKVEILEQRVLLDDFFKIEEAHLRFRRFDGQMSDPVRRLVLERGDAVAALLVNTNTRKVLMTNQFRYPTWGKGPGWLHEVVAGMIDENEQPEDAVRREIHEEIGYQVHELTPIATFYVSPGGSSERIFLFYAEVTSADRISNGGGLANEHEDIELIEVSFDELWDVLKRGEIRDAKTLIAVQWLQQKWQTNATHR
ncbi:NUDIX domain-containing protein [Dictyobacter aurantiacus]|uniref:ADP-ribose pyrophosphatase n=1 Tax=Dictyobacter aurantiacus TaxID=1936993 RepID=A0A401ZP88_9CHLR|nr:NUDIX domain-containing protein [Dictyobacter aurantiacus]GCE08685.1 ADP-ribose pyrophosphatase [Dictyobacter aurantiacus]